VLLTRGVAAFEDLLVCPPVFADLAPKLIFDASQGRALHAAEHSGLVLYAEQERVLVCDGDPSYWP
jgi:hypothetical protein